MDAAGSRRAARGARRIGSRGSASAPSLLAWLDEFAAAVRAVDTAQASALFAPEVVAFGTVGTRLVGRDALVRDQWLKVWSVTSGFRYDLELAVCGADGELGWAAAPWTSYGLRDGRPFERRGRATFVLRWESPHWLAIHSHHSLDPVAADAP